MLQTLAGLLQWGIRQSAEVSNHLTSVERILEYSQLEPEKQPEITSDVKQGWPSKGSITFNKVVYRYSIESEPVLHGLTFSIKPKEKIGIVGRTGAGKSSLIGSIFRLALVEGDICIDGVNMASVETKFFRSKISIIPQDPVLFSGTLRRYCPLNFSKNSQSSQFMNLCFFFASGIWTHSRNILMMTFGNLWKMFS